MTKGRSKTEHLAKPQPQGEARAAGKGKDASPEEIASRLRSVLARVDPEEWLGTWWADQSYQRKVMQKPLTKLVELLEHLEKLERGRHSSLGRRPELARDVEHDELERLFGAKEADRILAPESLKNRASHLEVLRKARSRRAKEMIAKVQRDLEEMPKAPNEARRRNREDAIAEIRQCDASKKGMASLVASLKERGFGTRVAVIDLDRYVRALWPEE